MEPKVKYYIRVAHGWKNYCIIGYLSNSIIVRCSDSYRIWYWAPEE